MAAGKVPLASVRRKGSSGCGGPAGWAGQGDGRRGLELGVGGMVAQYQGTSHSCEEVTFWAQGGQCLRKKAPWPGLRTCTPVSSAPGLPPPLHPPFL